MKTRLLPTLILLAVLLAACAPAIVISPTPFSTAAVAPTFTPSIELSPTLNPFQQLLATRQAATLWPATQTPIQPTATSLPTEPTLEAPTQTTPSIELSPTLNPFQQLLATRQAATLPVATSRGPDLHATDPTTVSLASGGLQFVEFFRFTWGTCRAMAPMVHGLEAEYFGKIKFTYLDADDPQTFDFQQALGFYYQPEVYLLDANGNVLKKWVGFTSEEEFETVFAQYVH